MRPRFAADYRTLFWVFMLFPLVPALGLARPALALWLLPVQLYLAYSAGVLTHNHIHCSVFAGRRANAFYGAWLSVFYGCPIAFWIPTHVVNHHQFSNTEADVTRTHRRSSEHNLRQASAYTLASGYWQLPLVKRYVREAYRKRGRRFRELVLQGSALVIAHAALIGIAVALHGAGLGLGVYVLTFGGPVLLAPSFMFFTSYMQHVHCDPASADNHSRNFVGALANWFVFAAGYHTVHHEHPSTHWSQYPALHAARSASIHSDLKVRSLLHFWVENYLLRTFSTRFGTRQLG
jgi:fatty acid desaturase